MCASRSSTSMRSAHIQLTSPSVHLHSYQRHLPLAPNSSCTFSSCTCFATRRRKYCPRARQVAFSVPSRSTKLPSDSSCSFCNRGESSSFGDRSRPLTQQSRVAKSAVGFKCCWLQVLVLVGTGFRLTKRGHYRTLYCSCLHLKIIEQDEGNACYRHVTSCRGRVHLSSCPHVRKRALQSNLMICARGRRVNHPSRHVISPVISYGNRRNVRASELASGRGALRKIMRRWPPRGFSVPSKTWTRIRGKRQGNVQDLSNCAPIQPWFLVRSFLACRVIPGKKCGLVRKRVK